MTQAFAKRFPLQADILRALSSGPKTIAEISSIVGSQTRNVRESVGALRTKGLVRCIGFRREKHGTTTCKPRLYSALHREAWELPKRSSLSSVKLPPACGTVSSPYKSAVTIYRKVIRNPSRPFAVWVSGSKVRCGNANSRQAERADHCSERVGTYKSGITREQILGDLQAAALEASMIG
jgi:hypothetical protein